VSEDDRLAFLEKRDGPERARAWALDAARTYRRAVLSQRTLYRLPMIRAYLDLKRYALRTK
jgi:hypothetical protein